MSKILRVACAAIAIGSGAASAEALEVTSGDGGPMKVELGYGVLMNPTTSLVRRWTLINDARMPVTIASAAFAVSNAQGARSTDLRYRLNATIATGDSEVVAYELTVLVLDVFGRRQRALSTTEIADVEANDQRPHNAEWRILQDADAKTAFHAIAWVESARTRDGQVRHADKEAVLQAVRRVSDQIKDLGADE